MKRFKRLGNGKIGYIRIGLLESTAVIGIAMKIAVAGRKREVHKANLDGY
jgi:hypothetical protein